MEKHKLYFLFFTVSLTILPIILLSIQPITNSKKANVPKSGFSLGKDTLDMGPLGEEDRELPITIYNNEDTTLIVKDVVSSCGCILLDKKTFSIPKHDSAILRAVIQRRKSDTKGIVHRTIAIRTNYAKPIQYIIVKAQIS